MSNTSVWFYMRGDVRVGPLTNSELRAAASSEALLPTDLIWKEGLPGWTQANRISGLFANRSPVTPPPPPPSRDIQVPSAPPVTANQSKKDQKMTAAENVLWVAHPSIFYFSLRLLASVFILVVGIVFTPCFGTFFVVSAIVIAVVVVLQVKSTTFTLTNRRVKSVGGILIRRECEVSIKDIRSLNLSSGFFEGVFGLGTIEVASAGTGGIEVTFFGVSSVNKIRDMIRREKDESDS